MQATAANLQNTQATFPSGSMWANMTTSVYRQIKTGIGVLARLGINTVGTTSSVILYDGTSSPVTISLATPGVISWPNHSLPIGEAVQFETTVALPTGLTAGTTYYVSSAGYGANGFQVADTKAHALAGTNSVNTSGSQSGVQTGYDVGNPIGTYSTVAQNGVDINAQFQNGLIAVAADGGGAANLTIFYY